MWVVAAKAVAMQGERVVGSRVEEVGLAGPTAVLVVAMRAQVTMGASRAVAKTVWVAAALALGMEAVATVARAAVPLATGMLVVAQLVDRWEVEAEARKAARMVD